MKKSIQKRVIIMMGWLIGTIVLMQAAGYFAFAQNTALLEENERILRLSNLFQSRLITHLSWAINFKDAVFLDKNFLIAVDSPECEFGKWLKNFSTSDDYEVLSVLQKRELSDICRLHQLIHGAAKQINQTANHKEKLRIFKSRIEKNLERLQSLQKAIIAELKTQSKVNSEKLQMYLLISKWLIPLLMATAVIIAVILCYRLNRKLRNFIEDILQVMSKVARGEPFDDIRKRTVCCSDVRKCRCKKCPMYAKDIDNCFINVGSYAPLVNMEVACPAIRSGELKDCNECAVMKTLAPDEFSFAIIMLLHILEQRERIKESFSKFVNKDLAEMAMHRQIALGGELQDVTILFVDIRSFTALSENLSPKETVIFLNEYMTMMLECIHATGGSVDKFMGDAIMAIWGGAFSKKHEPAKAVEAALLMRDKLEEFNAVSAIEGHPSIRIGCGICTGTVLAGQIGSESRMEYTVIGDAVNMASRLEKLNKKLNTVILISENTNKRVKNDFEIAAMGEIKVDGKERHQKIYAVTGRKQNSG